MRVLVVSEAPVPTLHRSYRSDPLAKYLSAMGHEVSVVCPKPAGDVEGEGYEAISFCHLPEQRYEKYSPISRYRFLASIRKRVEALLDEEKFDVIRPITFPAGYATITAKAKKPPVITNLSDFYSDLYRQFELPLSPLVSMVLRRMERRVIKGSDVLLVDAPTQRTYWRDWGLDVRRCAVLPNGVDRRLFNPEADGKEMRETYGLDETSKLVFYHGDLSRLDGVDILIDAAPSIVMRHRDVKLMVVGAGTGRYMKRLKALVRERRVERAFIFTGWVPYVKVPRCIANADVCVAPFRPTLTSNSNLPNKIIEYIAMGKPVITTRCDGIREMVGDAVRYVASEGSEELADAISYELSNPMGGHEFCRRLERIAERLDWRNIIKHEEAILRAVLENTIDDYRTLDYRLY